MNSLSLPPGGVGGWEKQHLNPCPFPQPPMFAGVEPKQKGRGVYRPKAPALMPARTPKDGGPYNSEYLAPLIGFLEMQMLQKRKRGSGKDRDPGSHSLPIWGNSKLRLIPEL